MVVSRGLGPHLLDLMLRKEPAGELRRPGDLAGKRRQAAGQQSRQGRFAVAIGPDQRHPLIGIEPQIEL
jgi:hypothetical protein